MNPSVLWIGLFFGTVSETASARFDKARYAAVNAIGPAPDADTFIAEVRQGLQALGLTVDRCEDVEPLETRLRHFELHPSLSALIEPARMSGKIQFGTFHVTRDEGDE